MSLATRVLCSLIGLHSVVLGLSLAAPPLHSVEGEWSTYAPEYHMWLIYLEFESDGKLLKKAWDKESRWDLKQTEGRYLLLPGREVRLEFPNDKDDPVVICRLAESGLEMEGECKGKQRTFLYYDSGDPYLRKVEDAEDSYATRRASKLTPQEKKWVGKWKGSAIPQIYWETHRKGDGTYEQLILNESQTPDIKKGVWGIDGEGHFYYTELETSVFEDLFDEWIKTPITAEIQERSTNEQLVLDYNYDYPDPDLEVEYRIEEFAKSKWRVFDASLDDAILGQWQSENGELFIEFLGDGRWSSLEREPFGIKYGSLDIADDKINANNGTEKSVYQVDLERKEITRTKPGPPLTLSRRPGSPELFDLPGTDSLPPEFPAVTGAPLSEEEKELVGTWRGCRFEREYETIRKDDGTFEEVRIDLATQEADYLRGFWRLDEEGQYYEATIQSTDWKNLSIYLAEVPATIISKSKEEVVIRDGIYIADEKRAQSLSYDFWDQVPKR